MSLSTYIFKPKHGIEITRKVIDCFVGDWLSWSDFGVEWGVREMKDREGWCKFTANPDYQGSFDGFSEMCWSDEPITGKQLTEDMMVLLVEAGVTVPDPNATHDGTEPDGQHYLTDVEVAEVIIALSDDDSSILSPWDESLWVHNKKTDKTERHDMTDLMFSLAQGH